MVCQRRMLLVAVLVLVPDVPLAGQIASTSFWVGSHADPVGLRGSSGSPALFGIDLILARRIGETPWEAALVLSGGLRDRDSYSGRTYGVYGEVRYTPTRAGGGPYLLSTLGLANTRVDDRINLGDGLAFVGGTDATTGVLGAGAGLRFRLIVFASFVDVQYQWRTNAIHGRHALPVRLGFRW
jgi:hypothetical protein